MGGGSYSTSARSVRSMDMGYTTKSAGEIFTQRSINNAMDPFNVKIRESRDSAEHPNSVAIILALDVTGSMGSIPHHLVKEGLPTIMGDIIQAGIKDPQLLFLAIGDHECDRAPLQVGQFESSDELLDKWLTTVWLEGRGGGNDGESYLLAHYFAAKHTSIDCLEKRGQKGFLFTIGDEPTLKGISEHRLKDLMGEGQFSNMTAQQLIDMASEKYHVYHLHVLETRAGQDKSTQAGWREMLRENLILVEHKEDIPKIIAGIVSKVAAPSVTINEKKSDTVNTSSSIIPEKSDDKFML